MFFRSCDSVYAQLVGGGVVFVCIARSFGADLPITNSFAAFGLAILSILLPGTPGYFGTFEYFAGFALVNIDRGTAIAMALAAHLIIWLPPKIVLLSIICIIVHDLLARASPRN